MNVLSEQKNGVILLTVDGEVDLNTSPQLRSKLKEILKEKPEKICVDLGKVKYIDSSGIATLIEAHKELVDRKGELVLCDIPKKIYSVFELAKLDMVFKIVSDPSEVIKG